MRLLAQWHARECGCGRERASSPVVVGSSASSAPWTDGSHKSSAMDAVFVVPGPVVSWSTITRRIRAAPRAGRRGMNSSSSSAASIIIFGRMYEDPPEARYMIRGLSGTHGCAERDTRCWKRSLNMFTVFLGVRHRHTRERSADLSDMIDDPRSMANFPATPQLCVSRTQPGSSVRWCPHAGHGTSLFSCLSAYLPTTVA